MRYRKLDPNQDYAFGHGLADFHIDSGDAVQQAVQTRLNLWVGDWFLDKTEGTDWRAKVLGKYTTTTYDPEVRARILGTTGVSNISQYYSTLDGQRRNLQVSATVNTNYTGTLNTQPFVLSVTVAPPAVIPVTTPSSALDSFILDSSKLG